MNTIVTNFSSALGSHRIHLKFTLRRPPRLISNRGREYLCYAEMIFIYSFYLWPAVWVFFSFRGKTSFLSCLSPTSFLMNAWQIFHFSFLQSLHLLNNPGTLLDAPLMFYFLYTSKILICLYFLKIFFHSSFQPFLAKFYSLSWIPAIPCPPLVSNTCCILFSYSHSFLFLCPFSQWFTSLDCLHSS